jgi:hypothetical protein
MTLSVVPVLYTKWVRVYFMGHRRSGSSLSEVAIIGMISEG